VVAHALEFGRALSRLSASERRFRGIAESAPDGIIVANRSHEISFANTAAGRILGTDPGALVGRRVEQVVFALSSGDDDPPSSDESAQFLRQAFEDPPGEVSVVYSLRALLERRRIDELAWLASHDPLTGLVNRRRFEEELELRMAESSRYGVQGALLAIDLDEFKPINDNFGHAAGDRVLQTVSRVLASVTRNTDVAARVGGDEFIVLLNHTDANGALACARKLLAHIGDAVTDYDGTPLTVAASIGLAMFPRDAGSPEALLRVADGALYAAKQAGRGRASFSPRSEADTTPPASMPRQENRESDIVVRGDVPPADLAALERRAGEG
jgi:diguanylate cyclase (GGDEF)-like protein